MLRGRRPSPFRRQKGRLAELARSLAAFNFETLMGTPMRPGGPPHLPPLPFGQATSPGSWSVPLPAGRSAPRRSACTRWGDSGRRSDDPQGGCSSEVPRARWERRHWPVPWHNAARGCWGTPPVCESLPCRVGDEKAIRVRNSCCSVHVRAAGYPSVHCVWWWGNYKSPAIRPHLMQACVAGRRPTGKVLPLRRCAAARG